MKTQQETHVEVINQEAGRCVKCALCSPVCPTYQITQLESESPRGRIAMSQALAQNQIPLTDVTRLRLDHCLTCRACEAVCPAGVKYGNLIDHTQALMQEKQPSQTPPAYYFTQTRYPQLLRGLLRFYQFIGLQRLLRRLKFFGYSRWQRYDQLLPTLTTRKTWRTFYPAHGQELGRVALFLGCIGKEFDQETLAAAIKMLTYVGYSVYVPTTQNCCGALALHAGQSHDYQKHMRINHDAFATLAIKAIVSVVTGCTTVLKEYSQTLPVPVRDINEFLLTEKWSENISFKPLPKHATLHTPCTMRNVLKQASAPQQLLMRIPELKLTLLPGTIGCCGAAGNYFLRHPDMSDTLLKKSLDAIPGNSELILTTNLGCQLQLNAGLLQRKKSAFVLHPIVVLAQQIELESYICEKPRKIRQKNCNF